MQAFEERHGLRDRPGLGHDRDQPARLGRPPAAPASTARSTGRYRATAGRPLAAASRCASSTTTAARLPWDGEATGELEVRGPWVAAWVLPRRRARGQVQRRLASHRRHRRDRRARLHPDHRSRQGRHQVRRRVDLAPSSSRTSSWRTPTCSEAAVIAVPHERWGERPLACVVLRATAASSRSMSCATTSPTGWPSWWLPDELAIIDEVPKTSVGKFDKKVLRRRLEAGELGTARARGLLPVGAARTGPSIDRPIRRRSGCAGTAEALAVSTTRPAV